MNLKDKNLTEIAQKMVQAARVGLAIEKEQLKKILEERQKTKEAGDLHASTQGKSN